MYDFIIVGAGLYGAVFAQRAHAAGKKVLVIEKRNHIGGNIYTERINGINVHKYGPHIFHTNNKDVWNYVTRFADFNRYTNSPVAIYKGQVFSLPFNMYTFNKIWGVTTPSEAEAIINRQRSEIVGEPYNLEEQAIKLVGRDIFEKLIKGYTEKQWGRSCKELPVEIIKRLPVRFVYDNNYFNARYQGVPIGGYTNMISNMLKGVDIIVNEDYLVHKEKWDNSARNVVYTGPIDAFYNYQFGQLEYRSIGFENENLNTDNYQGNAVVNYTDKEIPWTRIIEHKWFEFGKDINGNDIKGTIISKEFSREWKLGDEPYYPINDVKNNQVYSQYINLSKIDKNVIFGGRLAEYRYYDMDTVVANALDMFEKYAD